MSNTKTCEAFHHDADDDAKHGGAAIEALNMLQLLNKVQLVRAVIKHLIVRNSVGHFRAKSSVGKIRLVESTNNPGTDKKDGDSGNHPTLLARSVGRLST